MKALFKIAVFFSILVVVYYTAGKQITFLLEKTKLIINEINNENRIKDSKSSSNKFVLDKIIFPMIIPKEEKLKIQIVSNVKLAEVKNNIQEVIIEPNPQQQGADVVIAAKGVRTNWIFRFKDSKVCKGKISIEKFGLNIPIVENETKLTFAPMTDFTIVCDKGYFNYYIKAVDNINQAFSSTADQSISIPALAAVSNGTLKQNMADNNIKSKSNEDAPKPLEQSKPLEQGTPETNATKSQEPKKRGILDHIIHHSH